MLLVDDALNQELMHRIDLRREIVAKDENRDVENIG